MAKENFSKSMCNNFLEKTMGFLKSNLLLNVETIPTILDNRLFFYKKRKRKMGYIRCFETQTRMSGLIGLIRNRSISWLYLSQT